MTKNSLRKTKYLPSNLAVYYMIQKKNDNVPLLSGVSLIVEVGVDKPRDKRPKYSC